jgi:transposase
LGGAESADLSLRSRAVGALPIVNDVLRRLRLRDTLDRFVPATDPRLKLAPSIGLGVLLRNLLVAREPLYGLQRWANRFDERVLDLSAGDAALLNDDRIGRCLDALFAADRSTLMTQIVVRAVREFSLDLGELHNDSTTVTFAGRYARATGRIRQGRRAPRITYGHNKDHRPDLKQLLYVLTTTADGTVPIWCSIEDGNTNDDLTHVATWTALRDLVGKPDFLYVADSKLCTRGNTAHIAGAGGRFLTILPRCRKEYRQFRDLIHPLPWQNLRRRKNARRRSAPDDLWHGFESPKPSEEGFRILWIWSSQKSGLDRAERDDALERAEAALAALRAKLTSPWARRKTRDDVERAVAVCVAPAKRWLEVEILVTEERRLHHTKSGRPAKGAPCAERVVLRFDLRWRRNEEALGDDQRLDGMFPLLTNCARERLSVPDALAAYKHQPSLEKRHEQLKTVFHVRPALLKTDTRVEALLFLYFVALLVEALLERELRHAMAREEIPALPLYPEDRDCKAPTAQQLFAFFEDLRMHTLLAPDATVLQHFRDTLTPSHQTVLRLLGVSPNAYWPTGSDSRRI